MNISFIEFVRSLFGRKDEKFRSRLYTFLVCLAISIIIWFTIKLSHEYDEVITIPVSFTQVPRNMTLTSVSDSTLHVRVTEKGSVLFKLFYLQKSKPATINLKLTPFYSDNGAFRAIITPSLYINEIEREHWLLGKIISISPDTIYLTAEREKSKMLPVTAQYDLTYEKHFQGYGSVIMEPDCVMVKGPGQLIDRLDSVSLGLVRSHHMNKNVKMSKKIPKDSTYRLLTFNPNTVDITLPVEKYTEAEMEIPVHVINHDSQKIKTFPDKIRVVYTVALKDFAKVEPEMLTLVADFSTVKQSQENKLKVRLVKSPSFIHVSKIEPEKVEFIIVK